jgi:crossover junction endodeoxyribonuclease RusA
MSRGNVNLTIPWDALASSNQRNQRRGGRAHSHDYKRSLQTIRMIAQGAVQGERPRWPEGTVYMEVSFVPPDRRRRDVTNLLKGLMDALEGVVYADDYQVDELHIERMAPDKHNARAEVRVLG